MALLSTVSRSNWNLEMLVFVEGGKPEYPEKKKKKTLGAGTRTNNKLNPHMTPSPGIEPGPHRWEASALTTAPSLLPAFAFCYIGFGSLVGLSRDVSRSLSRLRR